jgi:hypothetical protein
VRDGDNGGDDDDDDDEDDFDDDSMVSPFFGKETCCSGYLASPLPALKQRIHKYKICCHITHK